MEDLILQFVQTDSASSSGNVERRESGTGTGGYGKGSAEGGGSYRSSGYACGPGYGSGTINRDGDGYGCASGVGSSGGCGHGWCDIGGLKSYNGKKVYKIDTLDTIIYTVKGDYAMGAVVFPDLTLKLCYIAKGKGMFAHGHTLREAYGSLLEKIQSNWTEEERIAGFKETFPEYDKHYPASLLFEWHHKLTGSCRMGREEFCRNHGIDIQNDTFTVREFVKLTKDEYKGDIIKKIPYRYGKENKS